MGRIYYNTFSQQSITAANTDYDLFTLAPADDRPICLWELELYVTSELGDAQEEWLAIDIIRGYTSVGSGGTSVTLSAAPRQMLAESDPTCTMRYLDSTVATTGTTQLLWSGGFNVRAGLDKVWLPELRPYCSQVSTNLVVRMQSTVADTLTMSGTLTFEEIAG